MSGTSGRDNSGLNAFNMGGMAASLGTGMALLGGNGDGFDDFAVGISKTSRLGRMNAATEQAVGDDDLEELIPSSLSDLLTPEERRRRMSRSGQQKPQLQQQVPGAPMPTPRPLVSGDPSASGALLGHRYSRSVPAPSLLGDLKSIWSDTGANQQGGTVTSDRSDVATPQTSNKPVLNGGSNILTDDMGLSMSMGSSSSFGAHLNVGLSPSNASAAFLPSLHHHYLKAKQQAQVGLVNTGSVTAASNRSGTGVANLTRGVRTASGPLFPGIGTTSNNLTSGNVGVHTHGGTIHTYRTTPSPFDLTQPQHQHHSAANRGLGALGAGAGVEDPLVNNHYLSSPSARALQAHAPGQSLPQGLAAGLSRIHALPPLPSLTSPSTSVSTDVGGGVSISGPYGEWKGSGSPAPNIIGGTYVTGTGGQAGMLNGDTSRMPYSKVGSFTAGGNYPSPPGLARGTSAAGRYQLAYGEPSRPTDDDELFTMDG